MLRGVAGLLCCAGASLIAGCTQLECVTQAKRRYEEDRKEEEAARKARLGEWVWKEEAGYYYNAVHRWYYDTKTSERGSLCG